MTLKNILFASLLGIFLVGCNNDPLDIDASDVDLSLSYLNLDSVIFNTDSVELMKNHRELPKMLPDIYDYQVGFCLQIQSKVDTTFYNAIQEFRKDTVFVIDVESSIKKDFKDLTNRYQKIEDGLKHLKYHLPEEKYPSHVVFMNTMFRSSIWCSDKAIGIGLERYLGPEDPTVKNKLNPVVFHEWVKNDWDKQYIERDAITGWLETHIIEEADGNLAEQIIRWGKIIYLVEAAYPEDEDNWILRYSKEELKWADDNKYSFWKYLVDENLLFENNERNAMNMLNPGPTTPGLPEAGGPDRMGQYLGWKMVRNYMELHEPTVKELIELPYNDILQEFEIEE
jgi:hypothetical protein